MDQLKFSGWVDQATRVVVFEMIAYSANDGLFALIQLIVEFSSVGSMYLILSCPDSLAVITTSIVSYVRQDVISKSTSIEWTRILTVRFVVSCTNFSKIVFIFGYLIGEVQEIYRERLGYFKDVWNYVDILLYFGT